QLDPARVVGVAVDRLAADHERRAFERLRAGDADVEHGGRRFRRAGQRGGGPGGGLDRADTADECRRPVGAATLFGGRGDDEDHERTVPGGAARAFSQKSHGCGGSAMSTKTMSVTLERDRATVTLNGEHEAYTADKLARNL